MLCVCLAVRNTAGRAIIFDSGALRFFGCCSSLFRTPAAVWTRPPCDRPTRVQCARRQAYRGAWLCVRQPVTPGPRSSLPCKQTGTRRTTFKPCRARTASARRTPSTSTGARLPCAASMSSCQSSSWFSVAEKDTVSIYWCAPALMPCLACRRLSDHQLLILEGPANQPVWTNANLCSSLRRFVTNDIEEAILT